MPSERVQGNDVIIIIIIIIIIIRGGGSCGVVGAPLTQDMSAYVPGGPHAIPVAYGSTSHVMVDSEERLNYLCDINLLAPELFF